MYIPQYFCLKEGTQDSKELRTVWIGLESNRSDPFCLFICTGLELEIKRDIRLKNLLLGKDVVSLSKSTPTPPPTPQENLEDTDREIKRDLIETHRIKNGLEEAPVLPVREPMKPKTFKDKWNNYWYHYKMHTFAGAILLILVGIFCWHLIFPTVYDASLAIVSTDSFEGAWEVIGPEMEYIVKDYNEDQARLIDFASFQLATKQGTEQTPQMLEMTRAKLLGWATTKGHFLYLLDATGYQQLTDVGIKFMDLEGKIESSQVEGDKYYLENTTLSKQLYLNELLGNKFLCIVDYDSFDSSAREDKTNIEGFEKDWGFFNQLAAIG